MLYSTAVNCVSSLKRRADKPVLFLDAFPLSLPSNLSVNNSNTFTRSRMLPPLLPALPSLFYFPFHFFDFLRQRPLSPNFTMGVNATGRPNNLSTGVSKVNIDPPHTFTHGNAARPGIEQ
ncbi:hypothetical protein ElyMa_000964900 [Elysia marginata]|uniref:Uncharacterized protein n=1 Tax=Elysia marginata TaxID=1093978 RepID=A0AAV4HEP2_9GAST|nr:hypothetical protein ElyMa_000964900 [Elysia marginata]